MAGTGAGRAYRVTKVHVLAFFLNSLVTNVIYRFTFPYAPFVAEGLGLSARQYSAFLLSADVASLACGVIVLTLRKVTRWHVALFQLMQAVGMAVIPLVAPFLRAQGYLVTGLVVLRFVSGLGLFLSQNILRAVIGQYVDVERRGAYLSAFELSWAASALALGGLGALFDAYGVRLTFEIIGLASGASLLWTWPLLPRVLETDDDARAAAADDEATPLTDAAGAMYGAVNAEKITENKASSQKSATARYLAEIFSSRECCACYALNFAFCAAAATINSSLGNWLHYAHNLNAATVGGIQSFLGLGEVMGCVTATFCSYRVGYKRGVLWGGGAMALFTLLFAVEDRSQSYVYLGVGMLLFYYAALEFMWLSMEAFLTIWTPTSVNKAGSVTIMMSCGSLGTLLGIVVSVPMYDEGGMALICGVTGLVALATIAFFTALTWKTPRATEAGHSH